MFAVCLFLFFLCSDWVVFGLNSSCVAIAKSETTSDTDHEYMYPLSNISIMLTSITTIQSFRRERKIS